MGTSFSSARIWYKAVPSRDASFLEAVVNGESRKGPVLVRPVTGSNSPGPKLKDAEAQTETGRGGLAIIFLSLPSFLLRPLCFVLLLLLSLAYSRLWRKECARPGGSFLLPAFFFPAQRALDTTHQALGFGSL